MSIRILLADDHNLFRQGLKRIVEEHSDLEVVAEAASGIEAIELAKNQQPDIAVLDVAMKELNGIEAAAQLLRVSPKTAILMLSMYGDERYVMRAMRNGARGYVLKDTLEEDFLTAIRALAEGKTFFSPTVARICNEVNARNMSEHEIDDRYELLTERERQLYHMLAEGQTNKDIAARLGLSLHTVETHRTRIMEKLGVHSIAELVLSAVRRGIVV